MKINTDKNCNIIIFDDTEYPYNGIFEYSETASLYIAQLNKSNSSTIIYSELNPHTNTTGEPIILEPLSEGFITFCHIILPKVNNVEEYDLDLYVEKYVEVKNYIRPHEINSLFGREEEYDESDDEFDDDDYEYDEVEISTGYFTDGVNIYCKDGLDNIRKASILEVIDADPETYGIIRIVQNFFSVCYLRKCFFSLCLKIFNDRGFSRCFNRKINEQLTYKRDLVWSALNVIQYMIDSNQLAEAQRLLERINGCNGLCSSEDTGNRDCGCE